MINYLYLEIILFKYFLILEFRILIFIYLFVFIYYLLNILFDIKNNLNI